MQILINIILSLFIEGVFDIQPSSSLVKKDHVGDCYYDCNKELGFTVDGFVSWSHNKEN
jgi:hypothetical protein